MGLGEGRGVSREGGGSSFGSEREAGGGTNYIHEGSLATGGCLGGQGGLRFGPRAGARECECLCICRERGHKKGLSGMWEGRGVSREGGRELSRIREGGWWGHRLYS